MVSTQKDPVLAVLSLSGGNDGLNTVIPYTNPLYKDYRPKLGIADNQVIPITDNLGFHPTMGPLKKFWDEGKLAIFLGIGYENPSYSHFRSMDIWHTCEPDKIGTEGWLGRALKEMDPQRRERADRRQLWPRPSPGPGYGWRSRCFRWQPGDLRSADRHRRRQPARAGSRRVWSDVFSAVGRSAVLDYIHSTGTNALKGADILSTAPDSYTSNVEYSSTVVGQYMKNIAQTHLANFGSRVLYTTSPYNSFDTHANQAQLHSGLWSDVSNNVETFMADLRDHNASDNVMLLMFTEFGRRISDNGSGTDHGAGGVAFAVGEHVKGGIYGEYPSLEPSQHAEGGNLQYSMDFRTIYSTILEDWLHMDSQPIIGGNFEKVKFL